MRKKRVGILFGGRSAEHEISLQSAKNIFDAIDRTKYDPVPIGITKEGEWILFEDSQFLSNEDNPARIGLGKPSSSITLLPWKTKQTVVSLSPVPTDILSLDVIFPVLHGPYGEDGTIQGFLKLTNIPFVGSSVLGSAIGMDKDVMKRLLKEQGIAITPYMVLHDYEKEEISYEKISKKFGQTVFIKPANLGSSVGVSSASSEEEFKKGISTAFEYDTKILIEKCIEGREVECAILGNQNPKASCIGEIVPKDTFYSYRAKYIDEEGASLHIPAVLSQKEVDTIQQISLKAYTILECEGMARVDSFLTKSGDVIVNEINTIPGFTKISMYPKLWEASGISYSSLIDRLIDLALQRFKKEQKLKTVREV